MIKSGYEPKLVGPKSENHLSKFPINWHPFVVAWDTTLAVEALGVLVTHCAPDPAPLAARFCPCAFHLPKGLHSLLWGRGRGGPVALSRHQSAQTPLPCRGLTQITAAPAKLRLGYANE